VPNVFAERLRTVRELRKLSQSELAEKADLQPSAVSHFETGRRSPSFQNLKALSDALKVTTDYLIGRSDDLSVSNAVEECLTSLTATAIRYAVLTDDPITVVGSKNNRVQFAFMSETLKQRRGLTWIKRNSGIPGRDGDVKVQ
jgi:transcriptional regulator with XRE-family HTH domain